MVVSKKFYFFEILICTFYTWYFLPVCGAVFSAGIFKFVFFACFVVGVLGIVVIRNKLTLIDVNPMVMVVFLYFCVLMCMCMFNIADANKHIRVSFTFWGTLLLYFCALDEAARIRVGKYLLLLFVVTIITSSVGVITDSSAARTLTHVAADDTLQTELKLKNISSIYLFQGMVMFVPILLGLRKFNKLIFSLLAILVLVVIINASFAISLIMFFVALAITYVLNNNKSVLDVLKKFLVCALVGAVFIFFGEKILELLVSIDNDTLSTRFQELRKLLYEQNTSGSGDAGLRADLYGFSLNTFFSTPIGIGPYYSYVPFEDGLGYHSQLIDDFARYGIAGVIFYVVLLFEYGKYISKQWRKLNLSFVGIAVAIVYTCFLVLNLAFRSGEESVIVFFVIPVLPDIIIEQKAKRMNKARSKYQYKINYSA